MSPTLSFHITTQYWCTFGPRTYRYQVGWKHSKMFSIRAFNNACNESRFICEAATVVECQPKTSPILSFYNTTQYWCTFGPRTYQYQVGSKHWKAFSIRAFNDACNKRRSICEAATVVEWQPKKLLFIFKIVSLAVVVYLHYVQGWL